jgi:nickel-type superoxide dismutase maturation protease
MFLMLPITRFTVTGTSMLPAYPPGVIVLVRTFGRVRIGDVVVCSDPRDGRRILKRVVRIDDKISVRGDNARATTDSDTFGTIQRADILGTVIYPKRKRGDHLS